MMNFSKWTLMYITCTPEPHPGLKCTKITTLWNHSNMCLYDTCYYDAIWYHYVTSTYDTWRVYDASSEWRRMMRTPRMNPYAACMYVVCMCLNDIVMNFFSVWCTRRMRRKSLHECCMKSYDVNMNVWRFREEMTEFREEMRSFPSVGALPERQRPG